MALAGCRRRNAPQLSWRQEASALFISGPSTWLTGPPQCSIAMLLPSSVYLFHGDCTLNLISVFITDIED